MNTPAHLILGAAAFARPGQPKVTLAAILGALLPDLSLYVLAGTSLFILGIPPETVFDELYFSDNWQLIFSIDNSFVLWGIGLAIAWWLKSSWAIALTGAALLHIAFDFPLHHDDGRAHFWPLSNWIFESPVSYWDRSHYGHIVAPIELVGSLGLCLILWLRFSSVWSKLAVAAAALLQTAPVFIWVFVFALG